MRHYTTAALAALLPLTVLAAPAAREDITVVWQHVKDSGSTSIQVWNKDESILYGEECGDKIESGKFANSPISFHVSPNGFGSLKYGDQIYYVHHLYAHSGGISCTKRYNAKHARIDCSVPAQDDYQEAGVYGVYNGKSCHADEPLPFGSILNVQTPGGGFAHTTATPKYEQLPLTNSTSKKEKRQDGVVLCDAFSFTQAVGDGDPHQNFYNTQLSENINCGTASQCTVGASNSQSFTIGFSADISADGWISAGFSVEESWETGNDYSCQGGPGDEVCIWYNTAHTAYTVQNYNADTCNPDGTPASDPFVMYSPNDGNSGGGYYCVIGTCRSKGQAYWDKSGRAGGP